MKNLITYLKALWRRGLDSQRKKIGVILEEATIEHPFSTYSAPFGTCWQPSGKLHSVVRCAAMLVMLFIIGSGNAWGAVGDAITSHTNIADATVYYLAGQATVSSKTNTYYSLLASDAAGASITGNATTTKASGTKYTFLIESGTYYLVTPNGYYVEPHGSSNGKLILTAEKKAVTVSTVSSKIRITGTTNTGKSIQKNKTTAANFGSYGNTQNDLTLYVAGYRVIYDANGATGGTVPTDATVYADNASATIKANTGSLVKTGYTFAGWNTAKNGSGTDVAATGSATRTITEGLRLYAKWTSAPSCAAPSAPTNSSVSGTGVTISTSSSSANYDIYYSTSSTTPTTQDPTATISSGNSKAITGLSYGTTYYYWMRQNCGGGSTSSWVAGSPTSFTTTVPAPTGVSAGSITMDGATFTITDANNVNNYDIYYSTSSTTPVAGTTPTTTSTSKTKAVSGLATGTYYYWVRAKGPNAKSAWVGGSTFTTLTLSSISVSTAPTKTKYLVGDNFDPTGLVITRTYSNSTSDTYSYAGHTSEFSFSPATNAALTALNTSVTITYGGQTASQAINVYTVTVNKVNMSGTAITNASVTATCSGRTLSQSVSTTNYKFNSWNVTAGGVTISDNSITGTPTGNVTINAKFHDPITVAWTKGGTTYSTGGPTTEVKYGTQWKDLDIPTAPGDASLGSCADKFMGWSNCSDLIGTGHSAPGVLFTSVSGITTEITTPIEFKAVFATAGAGGAGEKIKITPTNSELPAAGKYNGSATSFTIGDYTFKHNSWCKSADPPSSYNIQAKKNIDLSVYNVTTFENKIDHIIVYQTGTNRDVTITGSYYYDDDEATADGGTYEEEAITPPSTAATMNFSFTGKNHRYFYMSTPGNAVYMDSIVVYTRSSITYSDYVTKCCTPLGYVGGSVVFTDPTTAVLTWNAMSNVDATTPYTITYRTGSDDFDDDNVGSITTNGAGKKTCTITGLSCNTSYDFKIAVTADDGYCDKDTTMLSKNSGTWSVTSTIVNGTKTSVPTTACGDYTATFAATSGYHFPAKANVSVTGASDFSWNSSTGVLTISGANITGNITISITCPPDACSNWGFYYGTDGQSDWAYECFTKVKPADATDHEWQTDEIALPNKPNWYVDNATEDDGKKKLATWSELYFAASQGDGARPMVGTATGATGKVRIYDNWDWNNRAAGFLPTGYVMKFGSTEYPFAFVASNEYRTDIVDLNSTTYADVVSVGIEDGSGDYVSTGNTEALRHVFFVPSAAWKTGSAKFCIHYWDGGSLNARSNYMSAVPGKSGWYEGWLPTAATGFQFERQNPAGSEPTEGNRWTAGENQTLQSNKNCYTMTASGGESDWTGTITTSLYTSKGKFRMWDNSTSKNWYVTFYPHYVLHFDANSGTGAPADQSVALDASPCQLTVSSTVPTRDGYTFLGWNESSSATTPDGNWDGGDTHAMTGDVTLYAVWAANHTLTYNYNGGDGSSCSGGTKYTGESFTACSSAGSKTGYTFTGWAGSDSKSYTAGSSYTMPDANLTLTAQWSVNSYDVTLTTNGGTINAGNVTSYTYGVGATLPTNVTRDGYRFDGWFSDDGVWSDQVTAISTTATGDKTYYAKWTAVYTVTWHVNGSTYSGEGTGVVTGNTQVPNGEKISACPTAPADNTLNNCANKFMGWSSHSWGSTPKGTGTGEYDDLFTDVAGSPTISGATNFYAVFAEGSGADINTVMWSENWDGATTSNGSTGMDAAKPSANSSTGKVVYGSASVIYTENSNGTYVRNENNAGGSKPELLLKGSDWWNVAGIPTGGAATLTLEFKYSGGSGVTAATTTKNVTLGSATNSGSGPYTYTNTITIGDGVTSFDLKFSQGSNRRLDNISVKVATVTYSNYVTECAANQVRVTYDFNGGSGTICSQGVTTKTASYTVCSTTPTKDYYTFSGWNDGTNTYSAGATGYNLQTTTTFTAQWTPTTYDITYELDGGTNSGSNPATYNVTTATITLQNPTRDHDRFDGWYDNSTFTGDAVTSIPLGSHGDITLYAKWAERHEIVFDADGTLTTIYRAEDENLEDAVAGQGTKPSNPSAPSACSSKVFVGWSESTIDDETDTRPSDLTNATGTVSADKHYYAVWATESTSSGAVTVFNDAFQQVTNGDAYDDNKAKADKYTASYVYGTGTAGEARLSSSKNAGSLDIDLSDKTLASSFTITFKLKRYSTETGSVTLSCIDEGSTASFGSSPFSYPTGDDNWHDCSSTVTSVNAATHSVHFASTSGKRVYIKDIVITQTGTIYSYTAYSTSCCATKVTLSQNSPSNGTIVFGKTKVPTCGDKEVSLTITPATGYQLHTYEVATGSGKVATKSVSPAISLDNNSSAAQNITLTFADEANGAYDVTASFSKMAPTAWAWTYKSEAIPNPINLYVGQTATLNATYTPSGLLNSEQNYNVTKSANLTQTSKTYATPDIHYTFRADATMDDGTVTLTNQINSSLTITVHVHVDPLPLTHFEDLVHGKAFADVVATIEDNALSATKSTPTSDDWTTPNANTCEENHLHLVGWIREDWPALVAYLAGTGDAPATTAIVGAGNDGSGNAYFLSPGASINVQTFNDVTFYAVWAEIK